MVHPIESKKLGPPRIPTVDAALPLSGVRVLVIEDDYYLAMEAKAVLEGAGAEIIGPLSNDEQFQRALADRRPDCAVVDINLGHGPTFTAALRLKAVGVPFLFLTGYSPKAIPAEFRHIVHNQKPTRPEVLVQAVQQLSA